MDYITRNSKNAKSQITTDRNRHKILRIVNEVLRKCCVFIRSEISI
jgi:hypothetical protein